MSQNDDVQTIQNSSIDGKHWSKPCKTKGCGHAGRGHNRCKKKNGFWTGKCNECDCQEYTQ